MASQDWLRGATRHALRVSSQTLGLGFTFCHGFKPVRVSKHFFQDKVSFQKLNFPILPPVIASRNTNTLSSFLCILYATELTA